MAEAIVWTAAILGWPSGCRLGWQMSPSFRRFVAVRTGRTGVTSGYQEGPWKNLVVHKHETWYWEKILQELERWEDKEGISNIEILFYLLILNILSPVPLCSNCLFLWTQATCRFRDLTFPHGGFWSLEDANRCDVAEDGGAASAAAAVFAAAPFVEVLPCGVDEHGASFCWLAKLAIVYELMDVRCTW